MITVNWNTLDFLIVMVAAIRRHSPGVLILVVDNASTDGTRSWARKQPDIHVLRLPANIGHGPAMDIGIHRCRTTHFVALDVDAFPISDDWIVRPLADLSAGNAIAGGLGDVGHGEFIHASYLVMSTDRFLDARHTFAPGPTWDTAESISRSEDKVAAYAPTSVRGPGCVGTVFGDLVYHNFYSARLRTHGRQSIDGVGRQDPEAAWSEALVRFQLTGQ